MKTLLLASTLILVCASCAPLAYAQDAPKLHTFNAAYAIDPFAKGKVTPVVSYRLNTFHDVLDKKGFDVDLSALTTLGNSLGIGTALTHTFSFNLKLSREFRPTVDLSVGPWLNYQPGQAIGKLRGGLFLGIGGRF